MSLDIINIGRNKIKSVAGGEAVELSSLWEDKDVVIIFFRRWGCMFCRLWAKELSLISSTLKSNNVKLVGIGVEEAGAKEFTDGNFFDGDLYYVDDIATYNSLGFKRFTVFSILTSLFWKQSRDAIWKGKQMGVGGDLKGDWVQTGGALLVRKGGTVLDHFIQTGPAEHLSNDHILKKFNLEDNSIPVEISPLEINLKPAVVDHEEETNLFDCFAFCFHNTNFVWSAKSSKPNCTMAPIHNIWTERRCKSHQQTKL